jgi:predicted esterase
MPSWFDVAELPIPSGQEIGIDGELRISDSALREPAGLGSAVSMVHAMLTQAEGLGYESSRLVLGGVGQGGALALLAGRMYARPLGGIVSLGGWHLRPQWRPSCSANAGTPIMLCHGRDDEHVPFTLLQVCGGICPP